MKYNASYERNGISQCLIIEAASADIAERYFRYKKPDAKIYEVREARVDDMKPGIPVLTAIIFEVWKDTELGHSYKEKEFFSWWEADEYIEKIEKYYPGWHFRIVEVKV